MADCKGTFLLIEGDRNVWTKDITILTERTLAALETPCSLLHHFVSGKSQTYFIKIVDPFWNSKDGYLNPGRLQKVP
jgi:hypothetical protein